MSNEIDPVQEMFGISNEAIEEAKVKREQMLARKAASHYHCAIPDWTGQGGMCRFWINVDGSYESEDSRINESMIREGIRRFANEK